MAELPLPQRLERVGSWGAFGGGMPAAHARGMRCAPVAPRSSLRVPSALLFASLAAGCASGGGSSVNATPKPLGAATSDLPRDESPRVSAEESAALLEGNS